MLLGLWFVVMLRTLVSQGLKVREPSRQSGYGRPS